MTTTALQFFLEQLDESMPGYSWPLWDKYPQITDLTEPERSAFIDELIAGYADKSLPSEEVLTVLEVLEAEELRALVEANWDEAVATLEQPNVPIDDERWPNLDERSKKLNCISRSTSRVKQARRYFRCLLYTSPSPRDRG